MNYEILYCDSQTERKHFLGDRYGQRLHPTASPQGSASPLSRQSSPFGYGKTWAIDRSTTQLNDVYVICRMRNQTILMMSDQIGHEYFLKNCSSASIKSHRFAHSQRPGRVYRERRRALGGGGEGRLRRGAWSFHLQSLPPTSHSLSWGDRPLVGRMPKPNDAFPPIPSNSKCLTG